MLAGVDDCVFLDRPKISDERGSLVVVTATEIPFPIRRTFWVTNVPSDVVRGQHAHRELFEAIFVLAGAMTIEIDDGLQKRQVRLDDPARGLLLVPAIWRSMRDYTPGAVSMVFCSHAYDASDYILRYNDFLEFRGLKQ